MKQSLEEKTATIQGLEEKVSEIDRLLDDQVRENSSSQQAVLTILRSQEADEVAVDDRLPINNEFVSEVKKEIRNIQLKGSSAASKHLEEQAENIRYLQSQREETDQLFAEQQREIEQLEQ